jgi:hypothetical protein
MLRRRYSTIAAALLFPLIAWCAGNPRLALPDFSALADKASDSVTITLDASMLGLAARFLDSNDPEDAAAEDIIKGLQGIIVRSYTFEKDFVYKPSDIDAVRKQLTAPGWNRLMETRSQKTRANVEIYMMTDGGKALGLALIASEPRQLTIVNIIGSIDLQKLRNLQGRFGVPKIDSDPGYIPAQTSAPNKGTH